MAQQLRVWHAQDASGKRFEQPVTRLADAIIVLETLASFDRHLELQEPGQLQGLEVYNGQEWVEWTDASGREIEDISLSEAKRIDALNGV